MAATTREFFRFLVAVALAAASISYICQALYGQEYESRNRELGREADAEIEKLTQEIERLRKLLDDPDDPEEWDARDAHREMLGDMRGFAASGETKGGSGGAITVVDSVDELRTACGRSAPQIILFDESVVGDTWKITSKSKEIKPRDNKTVWGRTPAGKSANITIVADWRGSGAAFRLNNDNFVLAEVNGRFGNRPRNDDAPDFVQATRSSSRFWIYRCQFRGTGDEDGERIGDGFVDCYGTFGTVQDCAVRSCFKPHLVRGDGQLTLWRNQYFSCGGRFPHVGDNAVSHTHLCTILDSHWGYAVRASERGVANVTKTKIRMRDDRAFAVETSGRGEWHGSGNDFGGASTDRRESSNVDVPYDF